MANYVGMLTCSDEVQPSTGSFIVSRKLQTEANTQLKYHCTVFPLVKILIWSTKHRNNGSIPFPVPLVSDGEMAKLYNTPASKHHSSNQNADGSMHKKYMGRMVENEKYYLALINRAGGLYGRILTEVVSTDRTQ